ncbi:MAG: hypothetical protein ABWX90_04215 [Candidatus Saccharimonadales bacterium]
MFRKIVSNLAFSPALVGQLGFYARRLRKEEMTRRTGLIFIALALVVQSFAVFSPPESANASNADNVIYSGIRNKEDLLAIYDRGSDSAGRKDIREIYTHFGITRNDIANMTMGSYNTGDFNGQLKSVGRSDWGVPYRTPVAVANSSTTVYTGGFIGTHGKSWPMPALIGKRSIDNAWFAITLDCGNPVYVVPPPPIKKPVAACSSLTVASINRNTIQLTAKATAADGATISGYNYQIKNAKGVVVLNQRVIGAQTTSSLDHKFAADGAYTAQVTATTSLGDKTGGDCVKSLTVSPEPRCPVNSALVVSSPDCKPCPSDSKIWYKDKNCVATFELSKKVQNITQSLPDANDTQAKPGDQLQYTLKVKNIGKDQGSYTMSDTVADILEYATIVNIGDGKIVSQGAATPAVVAWPSFNVKVGETVEKIIVVRVKETIPAMAANLSNPQSYNCKVTNTFGNTLNVSIECPPEKVIEQTIAELPHTGASENIIFSAIVVAIAVYFYARSRQTSTEIRLIRRDLNAGTI